MIVSEVCKSGLIDPAGQATGQTNTTIGLPDPKFLYVYNTFESSSLHNKGDIQGFNVRVACLTLQARPQAKTNTTIGLPDPKFLYARNTSESSSYDN